MVILKEYNALSIVYPAVQNILKGLKSVEIRSWLPPELPLYDLVLVENNLYLNDGDVDPNGKTIALVDVIKVEEWTYQDSLQQNSHIKIGREWKPGYFLWHLENIREINNKEKCLAKKGIYSIKLNT